MQKIYDLYKKGIDRTLLIANLKRTPEERIRIHQGMHDFVKEARKAKLIEKNRQKNQ